jgi:hypothetical protein
MSNHSIFEIEEDDVVRLRNHDDDIASTSANAFGWVNVGVHAVMIELDENGDLLVEICPRTAEVGGHPSLTVTKEASVAAGGHNPDEVLG